MLTVYSTGPAPFTPTDIALFEMVARLIAPRLGPPIFTGPVAETGRTSHVH